MRTRATVAGLTSSAAPMAASVQPGPASPWLAFNRIRAWVSALAGATPRPIMLWSRARSCSDRTTTCRLRTSASCSVGPPEPHEDEGEPPTTQLKADELPGVQAGYSWWQAAAVPVVADGPAIYGMFRIVSRSRRGAKGAGYGWLLVTCGTAASIGGNVAHAQPNLVAQAIAAAIPLAVLAMLEGLKGDASEVTRLATQAGIRDRRGALEPASQLPQAITVRRTDPTNLDPAAAVGTRRRALPAAHRSADHTTVGARLQIAYAQPRPDGQPWTARTLAEAAGCGRSSAASFLQRQRPSVGERTQ